MTETQFSLDLASVSLKDLEVLHSIRLHLLANIKAGFIDELPPDLDRFFGIASNLYQSRDPEGFEDLTKASEDAEALMEVVAEELQPSIMKALEKAHNEKESRVRLTVDNENVQLAMFVLNDAKIAWKIKRWPEESELTDLWIASGDLPEAKKLLEEFKIPAVQ